MKKKITFITALCIALCAAAGCGNNAPAETTTTAAETTTTTAATTDATTNTTTEATAAAPAEDNGTVLYEGSGVKITTTGFTALEVYDNSKVLTLNIENTTGKELTVQAKLTSLNGIMASPYHLTVTPDGYVNMDGDFKVPAENDTDLRFLHLTSDAVVGERIPEIAEVSFFFDIIVGDDWENAIDTDIVTVKDPDCDHVQEYDGSGDVAYDKDGVKIVLQGTDYDIDFWGPIVKVCAYNGSDKAVSIHPAKSIIDGEEHDAYSTMEIAPGCYYYEKMMFDGASEMPPISTVTMSFEIREYDPWDEGKLIDSSEPFTAEYEPILIKTDEEKAAEIAEAKGWWTREGNFTDNDSAAVTISFVTWDGNAWYVNGNFGGTNYWGGNAELTEEGLSGTMQTAILDTAGNYTEGEPVEVKVTEDGDSGILLTYGTGVEYHLVPAAE